MKTKIWAHRGSSQAAPENTMAAFELALSQGADGAELDVHLTADKKIVVTHDDSISRVTGQTGLVSQMTLDQLRRFDFGLIKPGYAKQEIPTLAEVFDLYRPAGLMINIELKNSANLYPGLEEAIFDLALEHKMIELICLSSFNHYSMALAARISQARNLNVPCGLLYNSGLYQPWNYAISCGAKAIHPYYPNLRIPGLVQDCQAAGIAVNTWTINKEEELLAALALAPDAIITDVPDLALKLAGRS